MTNLIHFQEDFTQDDVATRLSNIAKNLGAINHVVVNNPDPAAQLIRESLFFMLMDGADKASKLMWSKLPRSVELGRSGAHKGHFERIIKRNRYKNQSFAAIGFAVNRLCR